MCGVEKYREFTGAGKKTPGGAGTHGTGRVLELETNFGRLGARRFSISRVSTWEHVEYGYDLSCVRQAIALIVAYLELVTRTRQNDAS